MLLLVICFSILLILSLKKCLTKYITYITFYTILLIIKILDHKLLLIIL